MSAATVIRSRSLPFTWIGTSRVASTTADGSTSGQLAWWIDDHCSPAAARRRDQSSSVMCGAAGASISSASRTASSHSGVPATAVPRYRISRFASSISLAIIVLKWNAS